MFWPAAEGTLTNATEEEAQLLFDASSSSESPLGSELSSLPPLNFGSVNEHQQTITLDMSFLDDVPAWSAESSTSVSAVTQPPSSHFDNTEDYTQTWRRLVHASSVLDHDDAEELPHSALSFDADPTPPLAYDGLDCPAPSVASEAAQAPKDVEVVAPKPIRLTNPAIHLAALVEESSAEDALEAASREFGYTKEQICEYMSDSESSEEDDEEEEEEEVASLDEFQFTYPPAHDLFIMPEYDDILPTSPLSALLPPATPVSPIHNTVPFVFSRSTQLRDNVRERRAVRNGNGHARHSSVPTIHYRPPKWPASVPEAVAARPAITLVPMRVRRRRTEQPHRVVSHSVDWSAGVHANTDLHNVPHYHPIPLAYL